MTLAVLYFVLLILNIWYFLIRPKEPLIERATVLLQIIGVYTFVFGLIAQTGIFREFEDVAKDMTSPDLFRFLRGNFIALSLMFQAQAIGLSPDKISMPLSYPLELVILISMSTLSVLFAVFYLVVVLPLSYVAYVIVSVPVDAIMTSAHDAVFSMGGPEISIKKIVTQNTVTVKNMLVAVPSFLISASLKIIQLHRKSFNGNSLKQRARDWFSAHPRTLNALLLVSQAFIFLLIITHAINTITSLTVVSIPSNQVGAVVGVVLVSILILLLLILLYAKVRSFRKNIRRTARERAQK